VLELKWPPWWRPLRDAVYFNIWILRFLPGGFFWLISSQPSYRRLRLGRWQGFSRLLRLEEDRRLQEMRAAGKSRVLIAAALKRSLLQIDDPV